VDIFEKSLKMNSERALMRKEFCSRFWVRYHKIGVAAYCCCSMQRKRYGMHYTLIFGSEFWDISPLTLSLHYQLLQSLVTCTSKNLVPVMGTKQRRDAK
jgi:hypothetical protein